MGWKQPLMGRMQGPLGLDIGHHGIKMAQLEGGSGGFRVNALGWRPTPPQAFDDSGRLVDPLLLAEAVRALAEQLDVSGCDVVATLSSPLVAVEVLEVWAEPHADLEPDALALLGERLDFPLDTAAVSFCVLSTPTLIPGEPPAAGIVKVLACAMPTDQVDALTLALEHAGLAPLVIEAAPLALAHLLLAGGDGQPVLLGDLGARQTTFALWRGGLPERTITVSAESVEPAEDPWDDQQPAAMAASEARLAALTAALAGFAETVTEMDWPTPDQDEAAAQPVGERQRLVWPTGLLVLSGGGAGMRDLAPRLAEATGLRVVKADGLAQLGLTAPGLLPAEVIAQPALWNGCLGLAVRPWVVEG